jgi:hypothetical protein
MMLVNPNTPMRNVLGILLTPVAEVIGQLSRFYGFCCRTFHIKPHYEVYRIKQTRSHAEE